MPSAVDSSDSLDQQDLLKRKTPFYYNKYPEKQPVLKLSDTTPLSGVHTHCHLHLKGTDICSENCDCKGVGGALQFKRIWIVLKHSLQTVSHRTYNLKPNSSFLKLHTTVVNCQTKSVGLPGRSKLDLRGINRSYFQANHSEVPIDPEMSSFSGALHAS